MSAGLLLRASVAFTAVLAAALFWQLLRPLLLHLFAAGRDWLLAEPLAAVLLLSLLYGALLACLLLLFALFPDALVAETQTRPAAVLLVILPAWLAPMVLMVMARSALPVQPAPGLVVLPVLLLSVSQTAHWWRMNRAFVQP